MAALKGTGKQGSILVDKTKSLQFKVMTWFINQIKSDLLSSNKKLTSRENSRYLLCSGYA